MRLAFKMSAHATWSLLPSPAGAKRLVAQSLAFVYALLVRCPTVKMPLCVWMIRFTVRPHVLSPVLNNKYWPRR